MKHVGNYVAKFAAYSVALLITTMAVSALAQMQQGQAKVLAVKGSAQYSEGGAWMPLAVGAVLKAGAVVQTAAGSSAKLTLLENGKLLVMDEQTTVGLTKMTFDKTGTDLVIETELNLTAGRIVGNVKKTSNASRYEVKTPVSTVGIRGTGFEVSATGLTRCFVGALSVSFKAPDGTVSQYQVGAGQTFDPALRSVTATPAGYKVEIAMPISSEESLPWAFSQEMSLPNVAAPPGLPVVPVEPPYEPPVTQIYPR
jgi:hypothetical protein